MRRGGSRHWTVNWPESCRAAAEPVVGHVVHRITATDACGGYWRVVSVRQVKVRKPLEDGYGARYRIGIEAVAEPEQADWTMFDSPRKPRLRNTPDPSKDRFSPLI